MCVCVSACTSFTFKNFMFKFNATKLPYQSGLSSSVWQTLVINSFFFNIAQRNRVLKECSFFKVLKCFRKIPKFSKWIQVVDWSMWPISTCAVLVRSNFRNFQTFFGFFAFFKLFWIEQMLQKQCKLILSVVKIWKVVQLLNILVSLKLLWSLKRLRRPNCSAYNWRSQKDDATRSSSLDGYLIEFIIITNDSLANSIGYRNNYNLIWIGFCFYFDQWVKKRSRFLNLLKYL